MRNVIGLCIGVMVLATACPAPPPAPVSYVTANLTVDGQSLSIDTRTSSGTPFAETMHGFGSGHPEFRRLLGAVLDQGAYQLALSYTTESETELVPDILGDGFTFPPAPDDPEVFEMLNFVIGGATYECNAQSSGHTSTTSISSLVEQNPPSLPIESQHSTQLSALALSYSIDATDCFELGTNNHDIVVTGSVEIHIGS